MATDLLRVDMSTKDALFVIKTEMMQKTGKEVSYGKTIQFLIDQFNKKTTTDKWLKYVEQLKKMK